VTCTHVSSGTRAMDEKKRCPMDSVFSESGSA
jgi:hypothetical protein